MELHEIAALLADQTRARMLDELLCGQPLPAGALAARRREVRLAGPEVAEVIEALGRVAAPRRARTLRDATRMDLLRRARSCYDHLAGQAGVALTDALVAGGALQRVD